MRHFENKLEKMPMRQLIRLREPGLKITGNRSSAEFSRQNFLELVIGVETQDKEGQITL